MAKIKAMDTVYTALAAVKKVPPITYRQMDCQAFVEYCVNQRGGRLQFRGSNDMFRNACSWVGSLNQARALGYLRPGAWLFIVEQNGGEPAKYKADGLGNASHVGIYTQLNGVEVVHSSASRGGVFPSTLKNGWTHVGLVKGLEYEDIEEEKKVNEQVYPVVKRGSKGAGVAELQQRLVDLKYALGP